MNENRQTTIAMIIVLVFGIGLFYMGTDGFRAYTAESARVNQLIEDKPKFPAVTMEDSNHHTFSISEFEGKYVFITFMYTACSSVCPILEMNMADVYDLLPREYIGEEIQFLSISFDPERDNPKTLDKYKNLFNSDGTTWRMARIEDQKELDSLLNEFGVIVIPDGNGNFTHNSAFYLVDREGSLINVMDYTKVDEAATTVLKTIESEMGE